MHFSAKRGLVIACRLSVCPSVCDVGGLWSHRLEFFRNNFIITTFSLGCSFSANQNIRGLLQMERPEIFAQSDQVPVDLSVGDIRWQIAAEWLQIAQRSQWRAYRKLPSLFLMVPSLTPYPKMGVPYAPRYANGHISATGDPIYFMFGSRVGFSGSADRIGLFPVTSNLSWRQAAILDNFEWLYLRNGSFDPLI